MNSRTPNDMLPLGCSLLCSAALLLSAGPLPAQTTSGFDAGTIQISRENSQLRITFTGSLLTADTPIGPWTLVTDAVSPYLTTFTQGQRFYTSLETDTNSVFSSTSVAVLTLAGPLQAHFDLALAGMPDGIFPPVREKPYFDGTVALPGFVLPASIRVRGNSSLQECPFPKLKFKISKEHRAGTPFADAREVKIATHCAEGGSGTIGRLRDQRATYREALAYELLGAFDLVAPRVRRAQVRYHDTSPRSETQSEIGWDLSRQAMIFEDPEVIAARLGARVLSEGELPSLEGNQFDPQVVTELMLFNAFLGNWDYSLPWNGRGVWNIDVLELTNGTDIQLIPVAGDFDLAGLVTGVTLSNAPHYYHPDLGEPHRETLFQVEQIKARMPSGNFSLARERFLAKRAAIVSAVANALIDEDGRTNAMAHVDAFYSALEALP